MTSALSLIAFLGIAVFLADAAIGALAVLVISIHRTSRAPLSKTHGQRAGSISRSVLAGIRNSDTEADQ